MSVIKVNGLNLSREVAAAAQAVTDAQAARTGAETAQAGAEAARDAAVDISNIDTSDGVVSTLVAGTAGAGPLTRAALSASFGRGLSATDPAFGAVGDGVADDTAAITAWLASDSDFLFLPDGSYKTGPVTVPQGKTIWGPGALAYTGAPSKGARFVGKSGPTDPLVTLEPLAQIHSVAVVANGTQDAIQLGGGNVLKEVVATGGIYGIDANYTSTNTLWAVRAQSNGSHGLRNIVDSVVVGGFFNANGGDGIHQDAGAGDTAILGAKLEWNAGYGLYLFAAHNIGLTGGIIDRNGKAGVLAQGAVNCSILPAVMRRNGRLSSATEAEDCHIQQVGSTDCVFGGMTASGANDDASGYNSPLHVVVNNGGTGIVYQGLDLQGCTGSGVYNLARGAVRYVGCEGDPGTRRASSRSTAGDITIGSYPGAGVFATLGLADLTIDAEPGDVIEFGFSYLIQAPSGKVARFDVATVVSGTPTRYLSTTTASPAAGGLAGLYREAGFHGYAGTAQYTVQAADVAGHQVTFRLVHSCDTTVVIYRQAAFPHHIWARNLSR